MSIALRESPDPSADTGGLVARRAVARWGWRLFRREWRQQLLVFGLLTVAVAAMVTGTAVAAAAPGQPGEATFGTATAMITLPGSDPRLAADIAAIRQRRGAVDVIESENLNAGTTQNVQLRAEDPRAPFGSPMLALVSGRYPAAPGEVALTSAVAALYGVNRGGVVRLAGRSWRMTGIVQNPSNLLDEFALVERGQVTVPAQVSILLDARRGSLRGLPSAASVSYPGTGGSGLSPAVIALAASVLGLVFIGLVAVAGFTVLAQRRLRALGMLSCLGATDRNVQLVMVANGAAVGVAAVIAGGIAGFGAWLAYVPHLQAATGHVIDPLGLPWWVIITGMALAVITAMLAARQPARTVARVPVVAALSGRPPRLEAVHRSAAAGLTTLAAGLVLLPFTGGRSGGSLPVGLSCHVGRDVPAFGHLRDGPGRGGATAVAGCGTHRAARPGPLPGPLRRRAGGGELRGVPGHAVHPGGELPVLHGAALDRAEPDLQPAHRPHERTGRRSERGPPERCTQR